MLRSVWEKNCKKKRGGNVGHDPMYLCLQRWTNAHTVWQALNLPSLDKLWINLTEMTANLTLTPNSKKTRNIKRQRQPWPPTDIPDLGQTHKNAVGLS